MRVAGVFSWMCAGLLLTATAAAWIAVIPSGQNFITLPGLVPLLLIVDLSLAFGFSGRNEHLHPAIAAIVFMIYAALTGLAFGGIALVYTDVEIFEGFVVAAGMYGATALYGFATKHDLTTRGSLFAMSVSAIAVAAIVGYSTKSPRFTLTIDLTIVAIFVALTARDARLLKETHASTINTALALYADLFHIFGHHHHGPELQRR